MQLQLVFFGNELHQRVPSLIGIFYRPETSEWANLEEVMALLANGHSVSIRPATEAEMARAEKRVVLIEMGYHLGKATAEALEETCTPEQIKGVLTQMRAFLEDLDHGLPIRNLVDVEA